LKIGVGTTHVTEVTIPATFDDIFHYEPNYKVLICKLHREAIKGLEGHLKRSHGLKKADRQPYLDYLARLQLQLAKPKDVPIPDPSGPPVEALGEPLDAFQCKLITCGHVSINRKSMQGHCNKAHDWAYKKSDPTHWSRVKVQTFFNGFHQRYFVVQVVSAAEACVTVSEADEELKQKFLQGIKEGREKDVEAKKILDSKMEKMDNTGWWNHTKWPQHFGDRHLGNIAHASQLPDRQERELLEAKRIVISMIKRAVDGLSLLHDDTPNWLRTANSTNRVENRPMVRLQNVESLDTYINYWVRFMCYCLRVRGAQCKLEEREERRARRREGDGGVASERGSVDSGSEDDEEEVGGEDANSDAGEEDEEERGEGVDSNAGEDDDEIVRQFKDCCELAVFNDEQKRLLEEM
jgi:uncharacterized C2H2 Zn-finger protein